MSSPPAPALDPLSRDYVTLAFGIERHMPGYVDAYTGPPELRDPAPSGAPPPPNRLLDEARALAVRVADLDGPPTRVAYLTAQLQAMITTCRLLSGESIAYADEVRQLLDIDPTPTPESVFEAAITELDALLPGTGPVAARMIAWRERYHITADTARTIIDTVVPDIRARTAALVDLPAGESVEFRFVTDQPWSGYNWYLGDGRSRVELNTDLPILATRLTDLLCHEAYPGHHTEHSLKEQRLYREQGYGEHAIHLINTPECVISEGIATLAEEMIFGPDELIQFRSERVYPVAGIAGDPERELAIGRAQRNLRAVAANAAILLHAEGRDDSETIAYLQRYGMISEAEAKQRLRFIADPLWRAYIFTYHAGRDLLGAWIDAASPAERVPRFRTLLTEQVTPSMLG